MHITWIAKILLWVIFSTTWLCAVPDAILGRAIDSHTTNGNKSETLYNPGVITSWVNPTFNNKLTASGDRYKSKEFTAAHRTLPFGTRLSLTYSRTGKSIIVRVNDRGPYIKGRDLDISEAAATALGMKQIGVAKLLVEVLN